MTAIQTSNPRVEWAADTLTIRPSRGTEFLQSLVDSRFVAQEWQVREDAIHAKSKTYTRAEALTRVIPS